MDELTTRPTSEEAPLRKLRDLKSGYYSLTFGPYSRVADCRPGCFIHVRLPRSDVYFRRPMSVASVDPATQELEIIFKVLGRGTTLLSQQCKHDKLDILGPLGVPFTLPRKDVRTIMVAGGVGFPPLLFMATTMVAQGYDPKSIDFFYGGRTAGDLIERNRIKKLGVNFHPATDDGSFGDCGYVTLCAEKFIREHAGDNLRLYGCGPEGMLKATNELGLKYQLPGELSLEAPMPCGIGVCLGCVVKLTNGEYSRVCIEGPVYGIGEIQI